MVVRFRISAPPLCNTSLKRCHSLTFRWIKNSHLVSAIPIPPPMPSTLNTQLPRRAISSADLSAVALAKAEAKRRRINSSCSDRCLGRFHTIYQDVRRCSKMFEDFRRFSKIFEDFRRFSMVFRVWKKNLFRNRVYWPEIIKAMQIPIPPHVTPFQARVRHQDAPRSEL